MSQARRMRGTLGDGVILPRLARLSLLVIGGGALLVNCGSGTESSDDVDTVRCVNQNHVVVDPDNCDGGDHGGGFFFLNTTRGNNSYPIGSRVNGGTDIRSTDSAARARAGLPSLGKPSVGTVSRGGLGSTSGGGGGVKGGSSGS